MGLIISFFAVFIILFLLLAMAVAEWTNRDIVELMTSWIPGLRAAERKAAAPVARLAIAGPAPRAKLAAERRKPVRPNSSQTKREAATPRPGAAPAKPKTRTTSSRTRKTK